MIPNLSLSLNTDRHSVLCQLGYFHITCWKHSLTCLQVGRKHCWASIICCQVTSFMINICPWITEVNLDWFFQKTVADFRRKIKYLELDTHTQKNLPGWKKLYFCKHLLRSCEVIRFILSSSTYSQSCVPSATILKADMILYVLQVTLGYQVCSLWPF